MDLVQDSSRGCLADDMPRVTEDYQRDPRAVPFDDFGPLAVGVSTAVDKPLTPDMIVVCTGWSLPVQAWTWLRYRNDDWELGRR